MSFGVPAMHKVPIGKLVKWLPSDEALNTLMEAIIRYLAK
jgi:hypothetical protein